MKKNIISALFILAILSACSTAKVRVMPGDDGVNRVVARDIERDGAEEAAYKAAEGYCKDLSKHAVYVKDDKDQTKYTGSMNESTRNTVRNLSKAAMILSPAAGVASSNAPVGAAMGTAGVAGYSMTSDRDYESDLKFKCM